MIKCAVPLFIIATCIVGIFGDEFCEKQRKLDSECAKYCYQVAKPLLQMAPVCHQKDAVIKELNMKIADLQKELVVYKQQEKKSLEEGNKCNEIITKLADLQNKFVAYGERESKIIKKVKLYKHLNVKLADLQNKLGGYEERERKSLEEVNKYNELNEKFIKLHKNLAVYEYREIGFEELKPKIANLQNDLVLYKERERKCLEEGTKCNNLITKLTDLQNKLIVYEEREKKSLEEGTKCNEINTKLVDLQNTLAVYEERERKSLEEGTKCSELNDKLSELPRILSNLEEREKKGLEKINLNKNLNVQLGEVQEKIADCEKREKNNKEINRKAESRFQASLEEYRVKLSKLESCNLALNINNQNVKEDLERFSNYLKYSSTCLKSRPGVDTTGTVEIEGIEEFSVRCVNDLNSGPGWMIIQERKVKLFYFYFNHKNWLEYRNGFNDRTGHFFIGLEKLYRLTNAVAHELYIDMEDFDGNKKFAHYDNFRVGDESEQYPLKDLGNYNPDSNAGDALWYNNNMKFSTHDRDNDKSPDINCAKKYYSGWWHNSCTRANLNGWSYQVKYYKEDGIWYIDDDDPNSVRIKENGLEERGIWWISRDLLKKVRILIRPKMKNEYKRYYPIIV